MRLRTALSGVPDPSAGTGIKAFVKTTQVEAELVDSESGERLAAIAGKTLADMNPNDRLETVDDLKALFNATASRLASRLTDLRAREP